MTLLNSKASFKLLWQKEAKEVAALREFQYKGVDIRGKNTSGTMTAMSRSEARFILERDGISELSISNQHHQQQQQQLNVLIGRNQQPKKEKLCTRAHN